MKHKKMSMGKFGCWFSVVVYVIGLLVMVVCLDILLGFTIVAGIVVPFWVILFIIKLVCRPFKKRKQLMELADQKFMRYCIENGIRSWDVYDESKGITALLAQYRGTSVNKADVEKVFEEIYDVVKDEYDAHQESIKRIAITYYQMCVDKGFSNPNDPVDKHKIDSLVVELAETYGKTGIELFEIGKNIRQEEEEEREKEILSDAEWKNECARKFMKTPPLERRIESVESLLDYYNKKQQETEGSLKAVNKANNQPQQKEKDWAIRGGAASALGGTAFGVLTALKVQEENARTRERNQHTAQVLDQVGAVLNSESKSLQRMIDQLNKELRITPTLMTDMDVSSKELMGLISFRDDEQKQISKRVIEINGVVSIKNPLKIKGRLDAVLEGVVKAKLCQDGKLLGTALVVLSNCVDNGFYSGMCICQRPITSSPISIQWEPERLWLVEKIKL